MSWKFLCEKKGWCPDQGTDLENSSKNWSHTRDQCTFVLVPPVCIQTVQNLQIFPNPAEPCWPVLSCEGAARRTDWSVTGSGVKASLGRSKLRPLGTASSTWKPSSSSSSPEKRAEFSVCSSISTQIALPQTLVQTSSKFRRSFVCPGNEAGEDFPFCHSRLNLLVSKSAKFNFVRVPRIGPIFPLCAPPRMSKRYWHLWGRSDYLGSAVTRDTGDPWESTSHSKLGEGDWCLYTTPSNTIWKWRHGFL